MIRDIVHKRFRPDESRVERLAAMIDQQDPSSPLVHEESDRDSEDFEAEDLERGPLSTDPSSADRITVDAMSLQALKDCRVHHHSGVCHVKSSATHFLCGCLVSRNYEEPSAETIVADMPICIQCSRAMTASS